MPLTISVDRGDFGTYKVHLTGALDSDTYREFESAIQPALDDPEAIAFSGYGQDEDVRRSMDAGFSKHLVKPVNGDRLLLAIGEVAAQHLAGSTGSR